MSQELAEDKLRSYLLGELTENEQDDLEKRLLADPELFETLQMIEEELVDDYVMGSLSESDRTRLESGLLTSAQQQRKVQLIGLLHLKANASTSTGERSTNRLSRLNQYFGLYRRNSALMVGWAAV